MSGFETPRALRVLIVGHADEDATRIVAALGSAVESERADSPTALRDALRERPCDVVLCEWAARGFERASPIELVRVGGHDVPVVVVSARTAAEVIARAMRQGARDWILKTNLERLGAVVEREVMEAAERRRGAERRRRGEEHERLSQRIDVVGRLAAGVAHDFNNVLSVIVGHVELLLEEGRGSEQEGLVAIRAAASRATELARNLLAFSRRRVSHPRAVELAPLVARLAEHLRATCGPTVEVVVRCPSELPRAWLDPLQLEQLVYNVVANAREAMPRGGVVTMEARAATGAGHVVLEVRDDGSGMNEETRQRAFEPFFSTKGPGRGLGLSTAFEIVSRGGGAIDLESAPGAGTTVRMSFPRALDLPDAAGTVLREEATALTGSETVLLVEDEEAVRRLVRLVLSRCGYRVIDFSNGESAASFCASYDERIDLLLTDVAMPGMSGRVLAERAVAMRPAMKVLFISGYTDGAISGEDVDPGLSFLWKPFTPAEIARAVRRLLDAR